MGTAPRPGHDDLPGAPADADDDLGALLGGAPADAGDDLDALLGGAPANPGDDLDNLLSGGPADVGDGLDDLLDGAPADADALAGPGDDFDAPLGDAPAAAASPFGRLTRARPAGLSAPRARFRIAILGDFSGRAARGALEGGPALAARRPVRLDIDDLDAVIARFATRLTLPLGADGAGVEIPLASLDDLHPDALVGSLPLFDALVGLRARVARGEPAALAEMQARAPEAAAEAAPAPAAPRGTHVPARPLTALQALLGDAAGALARPSPAEDLIARIVAPHVRAAPDPRAPAMTAACDAALASALRGILHHPDFRTVESTWRALDLIARRVGGGGRVEIMLHDISAAEWAADIAAHDDLADSALFAQLAEAPLLDEAQGPYSAVFGLYTLEETPSHAELMARMAKIAAFMDAPFVAAIAPGFLDTAREDRAPATARAWDALRALPEAAWAALASPGVLLRLPYGARTEPVDGFDFEEVDGGQAGTGGDAPPGLLWANAAVLPAILLAEAAARGAGKPDLGGVMSLDGMPVHVMTDAHGDQVAAPCAERLLDTGRAARTVARGFIPVLSIQGRDVVRQGSFQALGAAEIHGPWAPAPCPDLSGEAAPSPAAPSSAADDLGDLGDLGDLDEAGAGAAAGEEDDIDLDALLAELDAAPASAPDDASAPAGGLPDGLDDDLADLLKDL
ncbi:MAG: type VI secretion system contractile sheath large subunit [Pseudomonadota bacterium]|nr:type VI secretion system contractile sheath large subunit [Pseudomonadota bacterium]